MRKSLTLLGALALTAIATSALSRDAQPLRKTGWWDIQVKVMGMGPKMQVCTDPATEKVYPSVAGNPGDQCTNAVMKKTATGWNFDTTCKTTGGQVSRTTGTVTGDFQSSYHVEGSTDAAGIKIKTVIDGKYLGDCPAGRVPGDTVMGRKVTNVMTKK
jgi:hypothetical protein